MAKGKKKPTGIFDDPLGTIKSIVTSLDPKPLENQSLAEYKETLRTVLKTGTQAADVYYTGGMAGSMYRNLVVPKDPNWGAFAKDAGTLAATAGAAKLAGGVVSSGIVARGINRVRGQQVYVHGSPVKGIKTLLPMNPSTAGETGVYGAKVVPPTVGRPESHVSMPNVSELAKMTGQFAQSPGFYSKAPSGSLYVTKFKNKNLLYERFKSKADTFFYKDADFTSINASTKPVKVIKEISRENKTQAEIIKELSKAIQKSGGKVKPSALDRFAMNNEAIKRYHAKKYRKAFMSDF